TVLFLRGVDPGLNDLDADLVVRLVVRFHGAVKQAAVVELAVHVLQEIGGRDRRLGGLQFHLDVAFFSLDQNTNHPLFFLRACLGDNKDREQKETQPTDPSPVHDLLPLGISKISSLTRKRALSRAEPAKGATRPPTPPRSAAPTGGNPDGPAGRSGPRIPFRAGSNGYICRASH